MKASLYNPETEPPADLLELLRDLYGIAKHIEHFLAEYQKAYRYCMMSESSTLYPIALRDGARLMGHVALITDKRLPKGEAFFGFFELRDSVVSFDGMWELLVRTAREQGVERLKGPINGSIWHQYRVIHTSDDTSYFKAEVPTQLFYADVLRSMKPSLEIGYYSAWREKFEATLAQVSVDLTGLAAHGISIESMTELSSADVESIGAISKAVFNKSWGYTELTLSEFKNLYSGDKWSSDLYRLYMLKKDGEHIGFCGTTRENDTTLICKTICILPEFQEQGLGKALAYQIHIDARAAGFTRIIYALIREGNAIRRYPNDDAVIFRTYAAFEYILTP